MTPATPIVKDLVLVGGGHSHVAVLKRFGMRPVPGLRITLICRDVHTPYSGMLPGLVAGFYGFDEAHIDLGPLSRFAGARFYHDEAVHIDAGARRVHCRGRPPVAYDLLSLNIGSTPRTDNVPGAAETVIPVKPINRFLAHWEAMCERVLRRPGRSRIGVVGAGPGGVEILLAVQKRLGELLAAAGRAGQVPEFHLFSADEDILIAHNKRTRHAFRRVLAVREVHLHMNQPASRVAPGRIVSADGHVFPLDEILWVTQAAAAGWLAGTGLALDGEGFIKVGETLQSVSHPDVFAAGDIAALADPRPKSGVFAVREGRPLADNLRRALLGRPLHPFRPQRQYLSLIGTADGRAVASRGGLAAEGRWVWRWKDWIDRRFMEKYNRLPAMKPAAAEPALPAGLADQDVIREISALAMRCGGCGAKVGSTVLSRALAMLAPVPRPDVLIGLDAPDDAAVVSVPPGKVMVHTVDFFRAVVDDPYLFGQIAANHSLGDIFAMGGEPQTALAIVTLPYGVEAKVEELLLQLMSGALKVLNEANTALVGGHTGEGAELALGFSVNGLVDREAILRKGGMRPGDRLILTKPLGTGTLFAADMRLKAKGRWIDGALASMLQSNGPGARCLHAHGASACTDVTGFGLLGHLVEMAKPSGVDVTIELDAVPLLDGALDTVTAGIFSSLQPQNLRLRRAVRDGEAAARNARYPLIFDPQTAGGLLASVPADQAGACVAALKDLGYAHAAVIGTVAPQGSQLEPVTVVA